MQISQSTRDMLDEMDKQREAKSKAAWERATQQEKDTAKRVAMLCAKLLCNYCSNGYPVEFTQDEECKHRDPNLANLAEVDPNLPLVHCYAGAIQYMLVGMDNPDYGYHHMIYGDLWGLGEVHGER